MRPSTRACATRSLLPILTVLLGLVSPARPARADEGAATSDPVEAALAALPDAAAARGAAVVALGERALPSLRRALGGGDPLVAEKAAILLGRLGPLAAPALGDLVDALEDDAEAVRAESAAAIEAVGWPDAATLDALVAKRTDPDPAVRRVALRAAIEAGRLAADGVAALLAEHETRAECAGALRGLRGRAVETLGALLDHPSRRVRAAALAALATSGSAAARVAPALAAAARQPDPRLEEAALGVLLGCGDASEGTRRAFLDAAASPDAGLRAKVVLALADARFDGPETARLLAAAADGPDEVLRLAAALGAGSRGRASAAQRDLLARTVAQAGLPIPYPTDPTLGRAHGNLRPGRGGGLAAPEADQAWPALRASGTPATLTALRAAWPDATEEGRVALLRAFQALGPDGADDLRSHLREAPPDLRREAALCLATLGQAGGAAVPVLVEFVDRAATGSEARPDSAGVDPAVVAALVARSREALPLLTAALEAYAAYRGGATRPDPLRVLGVLAAMAEEAAPAAEAVARVIVETSLGDPPTEAEDWERRTPVLHALRGLGDAAPRALAARLLDPEPDVRRRAREALRVLGASARPALEALDRAAAAGPEAERADVAEVAKWIREAAR